MKLIIEVDENDKEICEQYINGKLGDELGDYVNVTELAEAIANGISYNPSGDCISREALMKEFSHHLVDSDILYVGEVKERIKRAQPVPERIQGEWIPINLDCRGYPEYFKCSICGAHIYTSGAEKELDYNGCPYCFADMRGEEE